MGLINVIDAVKILNGKLEIESEKNTGSSLKIILHNYAIKDSDVIQDEFVLTGPEEIEDSVPLEPNNIPGRRFLFVIDDDSSIISTLVNSLNINGSYNLYIASSVNEAFQVIKNIEINHKDFPQLIITDIKMPGMDGDDFIDKLKEYKGFRSIPVMFLTGIDDEDYKKRCLEHGICYIDKPFNIEHLKVQINTILKTMYYIQHEKHILDNKDHIFEEKCKEFKITDKQKEVLKLFLNGLKFNEIAIRLEIARGTVVTHMDRIYEKVNLFNNSEKKMKIRELFSSTTF